MEPTTPDVIAVLDSHESWADTPAQSRHQPVAFTYDLGFIPGMA